METYKTTEERRWKEVFTHVVKRCFTGVPRVFNRERTASSTTCAEKNDYLHTNGRSGPLLTTHRNNSMKQTPRCKNSIIKLLQENTVTPEAGFSNKTWEGACSSSTHNGALHNPSLSAGWSHSGTTAQQHQWTPIRHPGGCASWVQGWQKRPDTKGGTSLKSQTWPQAHQTQDAQPAHTVTQWSTAGHQVRGQQRQWKSLAPGSGTDKGSPCSCTLGVRTLVYMHDTHQFKR